MAPRNCAPSTPLAFRIVSPSLETFRGNMERLFTNRDILRPLTCYARSSVVGDSDVVSSVAGEYARLPSLAAHEFRTPANVVVGYLRMLRRDTVQPLGEPQLHMIDEAQNACARIVALINELGEVANLDGDTFVFNVECFDLFQLIHEVADDLQGAEDRGVHLQLRGETAGASVKGDRIRLSGAFSALFRAVMREQPSATIAAINRILVRRGDGASAVVVVARESDLQHAYDAAAAPFEETRGGATFQRRSGFPGGFHVRIRTAPGRGAAEQTRAVDSTGRSVCGRTGAATAQSRRPKFRHRSCRATAPETCPGHWHGGDSKNHADPLNGRGHGSCVPARLGPVRK